jgi:hypothetical protein
MDRMKSGTHFLEMIWYFTAERIVNTAISHYKLDQERATELRRVYLRPNDYSVRARNTYLQ